MKIENLETLMKDWYIHELTSKELADRANLRRGTGEEWMFGNCTYRFRGWEEDIDALSAKYGGVKKATPLPGIAELTLTRDDMPPQSNTGDFSGILKEFPMLLACGFIDGSRYAMSVGKSESGYAYVNRSYPCEYCVCSDDRDARWPDPSDLDMDTDEWDDDDWDSFESEYGGTYPIDTAREFEDDLEYDGVFCFECVGKAFLAVWKENWDAKEYGPFING